MTFAYEKGHPKPYVIVVELPSRECITYRWATAQQREEGGRRLPPRRPAVEAAKVAAGPASPAPAPSARTGAPAPTRMQRAAGMGRSRAMAVARTPFDRRTAAVASACVACGAAPLAVAAGAPAFVRFPFVALFFCLVPGTALLNLLGPSRVPLEPGIVVATSLAISALTAQGMLWAGIWAPDAFLNALAAASVAVLAAANVRQQVARE
jgi:hypothetical protein